MDRDDRHPSKMQRWPTLNPYGQSPVLYASIRSDHKTNDDSAESTIISPAMIVGLENLIIFCHFDEADDDVFLYMNHDDVEAEQARTETEQKFGKYLLDLVFADVEKHAIDVPIQPPPVTNQIFASLNGQVVSNQNQPNTNSQQQSSNVRSMQAPFDQNSESELIRLFATTYMKQQNKNPIQPSIDQTTVRSAFDKFVIGLDRNVAETTTNVIPLQWTI